MDKIHKLFESELVVGNLGSSLFAGSVRIQGKPVVDIDWEIPCGGNEKLYSVLTSIRTGEVLTGGGRQVPAERFIVKI